MDLQRTICVYVNRLIKNDVKRTSSWQAAKTWAGNASVKDACQILICSSFHPTSIYCGHNSRVITHYISSRIVNAQSGCGEKLKLWREASSSEGGLICSLCPQWAGQKVRAISRRCRLDFMKKLQTVLQAAKCWHRVTWKDEGIASPQSVRLASGIRQG